MSLSSIFWIRIYLSNLHIEYICQSLSVCLSPSVRPSVRLSVPGICGQRYTPLPKSNLSARTHRYNSSVSGKKEKRTKTKWLKSFTASKIFSHAPVGEEVGGDVGRETCGAMWGNVNLQLFSAVCWGLEECGIGPIQCRRTGHLVV